LDEIATKWSGRGWDRSAANIRQVQATIQSMNNMMNTFKAPEDQKPDFKGIRATALVPSIVDDMEKAYKEFEAEESPVEAEMKKKLEHSKEFFTKKFQAVFDKEGKDLLDGIDAEVKAIDDGMARLLQFENQLEINPNLTVNQTMEYFPGMLERVEREFIESENPWIVEEDPFEYDAKIREEKKHEHEHGHH